MRQIQDISKTGNDDQMEKIWLVFKQYFVHDRHKFNVNPILEPVLEPVRESVPVPFLKLLRVIFNLYKFKIH